MVGQRTEKVTGPDRISCNQAHEFFYGLTAHELSEADIRALSLHGTSCPACGPEFREWSRLRDVLQRSGIAPDADFKTRVMRRIREARMQPATWRSVSLETVSQHGWARGLAAAAVILIMLTGASKLPAVESLIAQLTGQPATVALNQNPSGGQGTVQPTGSASVSIPVKQTAPDTPVSNSGTPSPQPQANGQKTTGDVTAPQIASTGTTSKEQYAFDNKPSVIVTTTTIKILVGNLDQASSNALNIAGSLGADPTSAQSAQDSSSNVLLLHFTVDPGQANAFLNSLSSLGSVVSEDKETRDVTGDYSRMLAAYQALLAQQSVATGIDSDQYASQIALLKNELQNWQEAPEKQLVMLWLMH